MSIAASPDLPLARSQERKSALASGGQRYDRVLHINIEAQKALTRSIHDICSIDSVDRPQFEEAIRKDLDHVAQDFFTHTFDAPLIPAIHPKNTNLHDTIIDRITPALPAAPDVMEEVRNLIQDVPTNQKPEIAKGIGCNIISLYTARVLEEAIQIRSEDVSIIHHKEVNMSLPAQVQHARGVIGEISQFGLEDVRLYYSFAEALQHASNETGVDIIRRKIDQAPLNQEIRARLALLVDERNLHLVHIAAEKYGNKNKPPSKSDSAHSFMTELQETYAYINSMTPDEQKGFLANLPLTVLELLHNTRTLMNMATDRIATSSELREMFWQLRLGRKVGDFLKNHPLQYAKPADLHRYSEHLYDRLLRSEAAGFEISHHLPPEAGGIKTDEAITTLVRILTDSDHHNFPGLARPLLFTVIVNDSTSLKIHIPAGATPEKIRELVRAARHEQIDLSDVERAELTYNGYKPSKDRWNNTRYRHLYGHGQNEKTPGDYLICVSNTKTLDRTDPTSLFRVGPHKAAVGVSLGYDPKLSMIFNHSDYDGVPAKKAYREVEERLLKEANYNLSAETYDYLRLEHVLNQEKNRSGLPITEGTGKITDNVPYQKMTFEGPEGKMTLSPTDVRAIVIGLANNVDFVHHLFAGTLPAEYRDLHPTHNNVQPNIIGFEALRRALNSPDMPINTKPPAFKKALLDLFRQGKSTEADINTWLSNYNASSLRCKQGKGPAATLSAVTGTWEGPLAAVSALLHPGTASLMYTNGMFSAVFNPSGEGETYDFTTAHSDAYSPKTSDIDLHEPRSSIGVIGYNQEGKNGLAVTTCRKFPGQAQVELRDAIQNWFPKDKEMSYSTYMTLEYMTELVREWDKLAHGKTSLDKYLIVRERVFGFLQESEICGPERLMKQQIRSPEDLQNFLNLALQSAAQDTLNPEKLQKSYDQLKRAVANAQPKSA